MEYLDYYDEFDNYLGFATREEVHQKGLWHKTVHNWLYTHDGKVIFQIRKDSGKFYTTSSGHVDKGESIEEAFARETKEEVGLVMHTTAAKLVDIVPWQMDKVKSDGTMMKDRAKAHVFIAQFDGKYEDFDFDTSEVLGVVYVDAKETLNLFETQSGIIKATVVTKKDEKNNTVEEKMVSTDDFLVMPGETALGKYGNILESVIRETAKKEGI